MFAIDERELTFTSLREGKCRRFPRNPATQHYNPAICQKEKTTGSKHKIQDRQPMADGRLKIDGRAIWVYNRRNQKAQTVITLFIRKVYYEGIEARI